MGEIITLGNLISILVTLVSSVGVGIGFIWAIKSSVRVLETRMSMQDAMIIEARNELKKLNDVVTELALQGQRMNHMEERVTAQGNRLDEALSRFNRWMDKGSGT